MAKPDPENPAKAAAKERFECSHDRVIELSHRIHAHPELGWEEVRGCAWICEELSSAGFDVTPGICDLPTAFEARIGGGPMHIAICAEYDCLPQIGHACGHNMIAAMATGAGIALARLADDLGATIRVIGTPAEEIGNASGKVLLLERGAFDGVQAAMMVHPGPIDDITPPLIARSILEIRYVGKAAHASAFPEHGINAADALTVAQTAIGLIRQHIRPTDRVHGIITKGGDVANVVPAHTSASYEVRARCLSELDEVRNKVRRCFEAGALATGAQLEMIGGDRPIAEVVHDSEIAQIYQRNAVALGRKFPEKPRDGRVAASTDMGNVSLKIPSIHPMIGISSLPAANHQPEFTAHCVSSVADRALVDGALAMAYTIIDLTQDVAVRNRLMHL
jgi:amidohydrolase